MIRLFPLPLAAVLTLFIVNSGPAQQPAPKQQALDAFGDLLPDGAVGRIGTTRFRHAGKDFLGFTSDGKALMYLGSSAIHLFDPLSGKELKSISTASTGSARFSRVRRFGGMDSPVAVSADGKVLALHQPGNGVIEIIEVETGKQRKQIATTTIFKNANQFYQAALDLSDDGKYLVVSSGQNGRTPVAWLDTTTGERVHEIAVANNSYFSVAHFTPGAKEVAAVEIDQMNKARLRFFDTVTAMEVRSVEFAGNNQRNSLRFELRPDGKTIIATESNPMGGAGGTLRLLDYTVGKELKEIRTFPDASGGAFVLTRDGKQMFVTGSGVVHHWDVETGKEIRQLVAPNLAASDPRLGPGGGGGSTNALALSLDGKRLAASGSQSFATFDSENGKQLAGATGGAGIAFTRFTPDGKALLVGNSEHAVQQWDAKTTKLVRTLDKSDKATPAGGRGFDFFSSFLGNAHFSEDGKLFAAGFGSSGVGVWDAATGKFRKHFGEEEGKGQFGPRMVPTSFAFGPRGNVLAIGLPSGALKLFDAATGDVLRSWSWSTAGGGRDGFMDTNVLSLVFSPDGKTLAGGTMSGLNDGMPQITVVLWETSTGKERLRLSANVRGMEENQIGMIFALIDQMALSLNFSADGKRLLVGTFTGLHVLDAFTGKDITSYSGRMMFGKTATFSRDGKLVFVGKVDGTLRVLDATTGRTLRDLPGHSETIYCLEVSPDGKTLASGSSDSTVLLWDVDELRKPAGAALVLPTAKEMEGLWKDLGDAQASKAYEAMSLLASVPAEATAYLKDHIQPIAPADPKLLEKWLEDLNSDKFAVREKATSELVKLGDLAALALSERLKANPSLEMRQRMDKLAAKLNAPVQSPEMLQALRGVELLERIGTSQARAVLTALAQGAAGHRVTEDARAAVQRLEKQSK